LQELIGRRIARRIEEQRLELFERRDPRDAADGRLDAVVLTVVADAGGPAVVGARRVVARERLAARRWGLRHALAARRKDGPGVREGGVVQRAVGRNGLGLARGEQESEERGVGLHESVHQGQSCTEADAMTPIPGALMLDPWTR